LNSSKAIKKEYVSVLLVPASPALDAVLQMSPHWCWGEGSPLSACWQCFS